LTTRAINRRPIKAALAAALAAALGVAALVTSAGAAELAGKTTLDTRLSGDEAAEFSFLTEIGGESYLVRQELGAAKPNRNKRRGSLIYFGQLSDFQLADEESPSRVEFFDGQPLVQFSSSGHRPQETLVPHQVEAMIRQLNQLRTSPVPQGDGSRASMDNVIATGDLADSMQRNETEWVLTLLEGGPLDPNSGTDANPLCSGNPLTDDGSEYTGVQDYDDYVESQLFYDPDQPVGPFNDWPAYPGMVDRAQVPFTAEGLEVPSYVAVGNHDVLVQGNEDANAGYESVATGCIKPMGPFNSASPDSDEVEDVLDPAYLANLLASEPNKVALVPDDPNRQYADKAQQRQIYMSGSQFDDHGFAHVDADELTASGGTAMYYSFSPSPGIRFIALDTNTSGAGFLVDPVTQDTTAEGNIDDPQFQWLTEELEKAKAADELVVTYAHHASTSMDFTQPDELASPCTTDDSHGHDVNPGCDADPRSSMPIHTSEDFVNLLAGQPNVIAHVAGHSHENDVIPHPSPNGGFWEIKSPAIADWPPQSRLLEIMDNKDGTLSIFGAMADHDSPVASVGDGTDVSGADLETLASLGRTISFNDAQVGHTSAEGEAADRNVELLIADPRTTAIGGGGGKPGLGCRATLKGSRGANRLIGTRRDDRILGLGGADLIKGKAGNDCIRGMNGRDRLFGGIDNDLIRAGAGRDKIVPGPGRDKAVGGGKADRIRSRDGRRDVVHCGRGRDVVVADRKDRLRGCEKKLLGRRKRR
jgi:metallophosphoesterase (TIGR03767 family)